MEKKDTELDLIEVIANLNTISLWLGKSGQNKYEANLYATLVPLYITSDKLKYYKNNLKMKKKWIGTNFQLK